MPDLRARFRSADRIAAPDLWPDVVTRDPGEPPPSSPWGRVATFAVAAGIAALAILVLIRVLPLGGAKPISPSPTPSPPAISPSPTSSPTGLPSAGQVVGVTDFHSSLIAAADGNLFAIRQDTEKAYTLARIHGDGSITTVRIRDDLTNYLGRMAATSDAVYLGTDVIHRFTDAEDELVRIDANTLKVTARTTFPEGNVFAMVAEQDGLWVALPDRVLRLDPVTLAAQAAWTWLGPNPTPPFSDSVASLSLGRGGLCAVIGNAMHATLYRLEPGSLSVLAQAKIPGLPGQGFFATASDQAVWMVYDSGIREVDPQRASIAKLIPLESLTTAVARGTGLVAILGGSSIAQIDASGRVVALTPDLGDIGGAMAVDGRDVWISAGSASNIHLVLADVPGAS